MVHTFESILRDNSKQWIVELTYEFNDQETVEETRNVLMTAIEENWRPVLIYPVCAGKGPHEPTLMNPLEKVKKNAENFVNYREALKRYSEMLLKIAVESGLFTSAESESVRDVFWQVEMRLQTNFDMFRTTFFEKIKEDYSKSIAEKLETISTEIIASDIFLSSSLNTLYLK